MSAANGLYVVVAVGEDSIEVCEDETYNDRAYAWKQADELQAEADESDDAVVYRVYTLTEAPR